MTHQHETARRAVRKWNPRTAANDLGPMPSDSELATPKVAELAEQVLDTLAEAGQAASGTLKRRCAWRMAPLMDAWASSEIENVLTTPRRMLEHRGAQMDAEDLETASAVRLQQQLTKLWLNEEQWASSEAAKLICSRIKGREMEIRYRPGTVIAGPGGIIYTPPDDPTVIATALSQLWKQLLEPVEPETRLIRIAAGHYQFEAIHPFNDGNGRTGRAVICAAIADAKLVTAPLCAPSLQILSSRQEYYRRLNAVRKDGNWEQWTLYILEIIDDSTRWVIDRIAEATAQGVLTAEAASRWPQWSEKQRKAATVAATLPWTTSRELVNLRICSNTSSGLRLLRGLRDDGILIEEPFTQHSRFRAAKAERIWTGR